MSGRRKKKPPDKGQEEATIEALPDVTPDVTPVPQPETVDEPIPVSGVIDRIMQNPSIKKYSPDEVARIWEIHPETVRRAIRSGDLDSYSLGTKKRPKYIILSWAIDAWLNKRNVDEQVNPPETDE